MFYTGVLTVFIVTDVLHWCVTVFIVTDVLHWCVTVFIVTEVLHWCVTVFIVTEVLHWCVTEQYNNTYKNNLLTLITGPTIGHMHTITCLRNKIRISHTLTNIMPSYTKQDVLD